MATHDEIIRLLIETAGEDQVEGLSKALAQLEKDAAGGGTAAEKLAAELDKLATATKAAGEMVALKAAIADTEDRLEGARQKLADLNNTYDETERQTKSVAREFKAAENAVAGLEGDLRKQNLELQRMGGALAKAGVDVNDLVREEQRLREEALKAAESLRQNESAAKANAAAAERNAAALKQMGEAFARARERVSDIATKLTAAGVAAAAAATAFAAYKTGEFFTGAIKGAADFEAQISEIAAVSGSTGAELEMLGEVARTAALDTGESFESVTSTLGELARAVGDAEKAAEMLGPTLNLATAGGLEAAKSAEILTTTLTQFGLAADDATRVADLLANGANVTTASVEQLGGALSYAAPLARQLGMDVDETVAAIGALADEGFRGERAGTALRNVMSQLSDPASKFNAELDKLGIQTRNFNEVMLALGEAGSKSQNALLSLDAAARPAITALVNSGAAGITRLKASFEEMAVTAESAAKVMRNNLDGAARQAARAFEDLKNQLVQPLLEPLTREFQAVGVAMREFAQSPEFAQIQTALKTMFEAGIEGAREFLGTIDWMELSQQVASFADSAGAKLKDFSGSASEYIGYLKEAFNGLGIVIDGLQTGIFGIAAAAAKLAQVGAEVSILYLKLQNLNPATRLAAKAIGVDLAGAVEHLTEVSGGMGAVYDEFAQRTSKNFGELRDGLDRIGEGIENAGKAAPAAGAQIAEGLAPATSTLIDISDALAELPAELAAAGDGASGAGQKIADALAPGEVAAERLKNAFAALRIESQAELQATAARAAAAFETISAASRDGTASLADARAAFEVYARAQLAAAANMDASARQQIEAMLRIKGAAIGATEALERLGLVGAQAPGTIQPPADRSTASLHGLADAADRASGSIGGMGDSAENAGDQLDRMAGAAGRQSIALGEMSREAAMAYQSLNRYAGTDLWHKEMNRLTQRITEQKEAFRKEEEQLKVNTSSYANLGVHLARVRSEYSYLTAEQQFALAEARARAEAEGKTTSVLGAQAESIRDGNAALRERNKLLDQQKQVTQVQEIKRTTEVNVNFTAKATNINFDPSDLSESHWRQIAQRVIDIIRRDMQ